MAMTNSLERTLLARIAEIATTDNVSLNISWSKMITKPKLEGLQSMEIRHAERQHSRKWMKKMKWDARSASQRDPTSNLMNKKSSSAHSKNR